MKIDEARFIKSATTHDQYPDLGLPEVAFAGRSNVGKSSLLNRMMSRKRLARVSGTPGHTQLLNFYVVNDQYALCDLPGYGFAKVPDRVRSGWKGMIEEYLADRETLVAIVVIVDVRRGVRAEDRALIEGVASVGLQPIVVATKCDKLKPNALRKRRREIAAELGAADEGEIVWFSSETGEGRADLWRRIRGLLPSV